MRIFVLKGFFFIVLSFLSNQSAAGVEGEQPQMLQFFRQINNFELTLKKEMQAHTDRMEEGLRWYGQALLNYGNGPHPLSKERLIALEPYCGVLGDAPPTLDREAHRIARINHLAQAGSAAVWGMVEYREIAKWLVNQPRKKVEKHLGAYCERLSNLKTTLDCVREGRGDCPVDNYIQKVESQKPVVFVPSVQPMKEVVAPVVDELIAAVLPREIATKKLPVQVVGVAGNLSERYKKALACANADSGQPCKERVEFVEEILKVAQVALERKARVYVYDRWHELPKALRNSIAGLPADQLALAEAAWMRIKDGKLPEDLLKEAETMGQVALVRSLKRIEDEIALENMVIHILDHADSMAKELKSMGVQLEVQALEEVSNQATAVVTKVDEAICNALVDGSSEDSKPLNQWGRAPEGDTPGYRFTATPQTSVSPEDVLNESRGGTQAYSVRMEVILPVRLPAEMSSVLKGVRKKLEDGSEGEPLCPERKVATTRVIDADFEIRSVKKRADGSWEIATRPGDPNNEKTGDASHVLFEVFGVPMSWASGSYQWAVSRDFRNVKVTVPSVEVSFDVIKDGAWVFSPEALMAPVCKHIERRIKRSLKEWDGLSALRMNSGAGGISFESLTTQANVSPKVRLCDLNNTSTRSDWTRKDLLSTSVQIATVLKGQVGGAPFEWTGGAKLRFTPAASPKLVSYQLGKAPQAITQYAERLVRKSIPKTITAGSVTVTPGIPFLPDRIEKGAHPLKGLTLPSTVAVESTECRLPPFALNVGILSGKLESSDGRTALKDLANCAVRGLAKTVLPKFDDCAEPFEMIAVGMIKPTVDQRTENGCRLSLQVGGGQGITLSPVKVDTRTTPFTVDFSEVSVDGTQTYIDEIRKEIDQFLDLGRVRIENPRFDKDALAFNAIVTDLPVVGDLDLGPMYVTLAGDFKADSSPDVVLRNAVLGALFPLVKGHLEAAAKALVPQNSSIQLYLGLNANDACRELAKVSIGDIESNSGLCAYVEGKIPVYGGVEVPYEVSLWPHLDVEPQIEEAAIAALAGALNDLVGDYIKGEISLPGVSISKPRVSIGPDWDIGLLLSASIELPALGIIAVDPVRIDRKGVQVKARVETVVDLKGGAILLYPGPPVPIYLTRAGLFVDFEKKTGGAMGGFTAIAPTMDKLVRIDASLELNPNRLSQIGLKGDAVLVNTINLMSAEGEVDILKGSASFEAATAPILRFLIDGGASGYLRAGDGVLGFKAGMSVLGISFGEGEVSLKLRECFKGKRCFLLRANRVTLLLGVEARGGLELDLLLVNSKVDVAFELRLFETSFGRASLDAELFSAVLKARILDVFNLTVITPGLGIMSPHYIASIIADLLSIDLKDLLKIDPKDIVIAPAGDVGGDPAPPSSGGSDGDGEQDGGQQGGQNQGLPDQAVEEAEKNGTKAPPGGKAAQKAPKKYAMPKQPPPHSNNGTYAACREDRKTGELSYGGVWWWIWGSEKRFYYWPQLRSLDQDQFKLLCPKLDGYTNTQNKVESDVPGAFVIKPKFAPISIVSSFRESRNSREVRREAGQGWVFPVFEVRKFEGGDKEIQGIDDALFNERMRRKDYLKPSGKPRLLKPCEIDLSEDEVDTFLTYKRDSMLEKDLKRLAISRWTESCDSDGQRIDSDERLEDVRILEIDDGWFSNLVKVSAQAKRTDGGGKSSEYETATLLYAFDTQETYALLGCQYYERRESRSWKGFFYHHLQPKPRECRHRIIKPIEVAKVFKALGVSVDESEHGFRITDTGAAMAFLNESLPALFEGRKVPQERKRVGDRSPVCAKGSIVRVTRFEERPKFEFFVTFDRKTSGRQMELHEIEEKVIEVDRFIGLKSLISERSRWAPTLLNIAVCDQEEPDVNGWLKRRHRWLQPARKDKRLALYLPEGSRDASQDKVEVYMIDAPEVTTFFAPHYDPYKNDQSELGEKSRRVILEQFAKRGFNRARLIVNRSSDEGGREYALFYTDENTNNEKVEIQIREAAKDGVALSGKVRVGSEGSAFNKVMVFDASKLERCVNENTSGAGARLSLLDYLKMENPEDRGYTSPETLLIPFFEVKTDCRPAALRR